MFLRWAKEEGVVGKEGEDDEDGDSDDDGNDNEKAKPARKQWGKEDVEVRGCCGYHVAKSPGYGLLTIETLVNKFCPTNDFFIWYLEEFLMAKSLPVTGTGTLVSEQGIEAAFRLGMERKCNGSGLLQLSSGSMV